MSAETRHVNTNGGKTHLVNIETIAQAINIDIKELIAFIKKQVGCSIVNKNGWLVTGTKDPVTLDDIVEKYICANVLCDTCGNPEFSENSAGTKRRCKACGVVRKCH